MSGLTKALPNFFGGVSQQAAVSRHVTQCESLVNGDPAIAEGLGKRAPTEHIDDLDTGTETSFIHWINRDPTQRYVVVITNGGLAVYDLSGVKQTLVTPDGLAYLSHAVPREGFTAVTVADYTFIVNKSVVVALDAAVGSGSLTGTVQQYSDLPGSPSPGNVYRIEGTPSTQFDDYYVTWNGTVWVETVKPGIQNTPNASTMPWQLTKTGATEFTFRKATWANRLVGDLDSNPAPSFIGQTIKDVFFIRNRLGFLAGEQSVKSRSGDPFNFWAETVTASLDSDPIDVSVSTNKVANLFHAVPFNKSLVLFSNTTQFQLTAGDVLTPKTAKLDPTTEFESSTVARPASAGSSLFFAVPKEKSTGIREYYVDQETVSNDAADLTAHTPSYIPPGVFELVCSTAQDLLVLLSTTDRNKLWLYKYYWSGDEKVQSAWHQWEFDSTVKVLGAEFYGSVLYLVLLRGSTVFLERIVMDRSTTDTGLGFRALLDRKVSLTGVYDAGNNWTTWTLPYAEAGAMTVVLGSAFGVNSGTAPVTTRPSSSTLRTPGDYSAGSCVVGLNYTFRQVLSTIFLRDDKGVAVIGGVLTLHAFNIWLENTGYLRAEVTIRGRDKFTYEFTGQEVGTLTLGELTISDGVFSFPCLGKNTHTTIELINDNYLPCNLIMAEWDGNYESRRARS